jgi:hypothetical protein
MQLIGISLTSKNVALVDVVANLLSNFQMFFEVERGKKEGLLI